MHEEQPADRSARLDCRILLAHVSKEDGQIFRQMKGYRGEYVVHETESGVLVLMVFVFLAIADHTGYLEDQLQEQDSGCAVGVPDACDVEVEICVYFSWPVAHLERWSGLFLVCLADCPGFEACRPSTLPLGESLVENNGFVVELV